jgi:excisionase family DNA binding protein
MSELPDSGSMHVPCIPVKPAESGRGAGTSGCEGVTLAGTGGTLPPMTAPEVPPHESTAGESAASGFPPVLTTAMAAELLQVHVEYLRRMVREGRIPCHRFPGGREMRFLRDELLEWLAALPGEDQSTSTGRTQLTDPVGT